MQRLRITFARGEGAKYLSHLELMRVWERALRRAGWRVAHSHGFNPHPRMSFAAPLPVGVAAEADLLDVHLEQSRPVGEALQELARQMPEGMQVRRVEEIPETAPVMQRLMAAAEYRALCPVSTSGEELLRGVERMLSAGNLPRRRTRDGKSLSYDLRPMIRALKVDPTVEGRPVLWMELRSDAQGAGRPDEVLRELGLDPADCSITRVRLLLAEDGYQQAKTGG